MRALMDSNDDVTGPINIGNPKEFTMLELAREIQKKLGQTEMSFQPLPQDDPKQRRPDIALAKQLLDWQPHVVLADGLEKTIPWFATALDLDAPQRKIS